MDYLWNAIVEANQSKMVQPSLTPKKISYLGYASMEIIASSSPIVKSLVTTSPQILCQRRASRRLEVLAATSWIAETLSWVEISAQHHSAPSTCVSSYHGHASSCVSKERQALVLKNFSNKRVHLRLNVSGPDFQLAQSEMDSILFQRNEIRIVVVDFSLTLIRSATGSTSIQPSSSSYTLTRGRSTATTTVASRAERRFERPAARLLVLVPDQRVAAHCQAVPNRRVQGTTSKALSFSFPNCTRSAHLWTTPPSMSPLFMIIFILMLICYKQIITITIFVLMSLKIQQGN